jgi:Skp family chaperone for outer membrane proteins
LTFEQYCRSLLLGALCVAAVAFSAAAGDRLPTATGQITPPVKAAINTRQATQKAEAAWREERETLVARLTTLENEAVRLKGEQSERQTEIDAARTRLAAKQKQLADMEEISGRIEPFVAQLARALSQRLAEDPPFLDGERRQRLAALDALLADPDAAVSEKYRKTMEALLIEAEYGFTIETYRETISVDDQSLLVDIFRLGRLGLFFQSLDRSRCGFFNVATRSWQPLADHYNAALTTAIEIAAKRRSVEILHLPLGRMVVP